MLRVDVLRRFEARFADRPLMERAGQAGAEVARSLLASGAGPVVVLAGPGNNGGDAFVVARLLRSWFYDVVVVFVGDAGRLPADAAAAYREFAAAGGTTVAAPPSRRPALVIDGLFGIGLARPAAPPYAALVNWANGARAPILALDIPTGVDADTGQVREPAIRASATATFIAHKPGLLTGPGIDHAGVVTVHTLDVDVETDGPAEGHALAWALLAARLPDVLLRRGRDVHKGTFGTLAVIGGDSGLVGAPLLASRAAVKCGAGKVRVGFVADAFPPVDLACPETMLATAGIVLSREADALVVGCGLGTGEHAKAALQQALASPSPIVVDADGLNLIASDRALQEAARQREGATLATPHPAEAARLLATGIARVQQDRLAAAGAIARMLNAHVVLKGAGSVLAHPDGTFAINTSGSAALATGGTGDVLAGVLGALVAQRVPANEALRVGVCLHGAAADELVGRGIGPVGLAASELPDAARHLINGAAAALR